MRGFTRNLYAFTQLHTLVLLPGLSFFSHHLLLYLVMEKKCIYSWYRLDNTVTIIYFPIVRALQYSDH